MVAHNEERAAARAARCRMSAARRPRRTAPPHLLPPTYDIAFLFHNSYTIESLQRRRVKTMIPEVKTARKPFIFNLLSQNKIGCKLKYVLSPATGIAKVFVTVLLCLTIMLDNTHVWWTAIGRGRENMYRARTQMLCAIDINKEDVKTKGVDEDCGNYLCSGYSHITILLYSASYG